jgi:hypothetical protein
VSGTKLAHQIKGIKGIKGVRKGSGVFVLISGDATLGFSLCDEQFDTVTTQGERIL